MSLVDGLFTIGYSAFMVKDFLDALMHYGINVVIDVRSQPYSANYSGYNRENIEQALKRKGIHYRNYAREFGARQTDLRFFSPEGYLDFELFSESPNFIRGIDNLKSSMAQGYSVALMCAEKNPAICHRSIMISRVLYGNGYNVNHILADGGIETQSDIESQLLDRYFPDRQQLSLFGEEDQDFLIASAYKKRNAEIGYRIEEDNHEFIHDWVHEKKRTSFF